MNILLFGASGMVGSRIAAEALARGHRVTGVTRTAAAATDAPADPNLTLATADANDSHAVAELASGHDAVVSAIAPPRDGTPPTGPFLAVASSVIDGTRESGVKRLVWVGGAGSLLVDGVRLSETEGFPAAYKGEADAQGEVLDVFRDITDLDWTYVSPAAEIGPGERTGTFRTGGDALVADANGNSRISAEDYAIAVVDALENGDHVRERITVAY